MYVDDAVFGADTEDEAYSLYTNSKDVLGHRSFNLRKFITNSRTLQKAVNIKELSQLNVEPRVTMNLRKLMSSQRCLPHAIFVMSQVFFGLDGTSSTTS